MLEVLCRGHCAVPKPSYQRTCHTGVSFFVSARLNTACGIFAMLPVQSLMPLGGRTITEVLKLGALSANTITEEPIDMVLFESYPEAVSVCECVYVCMCERQRHSGA